MPSVSSLLQSPQLRFGKCTTIQIFNQNETFRGSEDLNPLAFLQAPRLDRHSVQANNLKTGVINFTKSLVGVFFFLKKIYYQLLKLNTSFQEHGANTFLLLSFSTYKYNISFPQIYSFYTNTKKKSANVENFLSSFAFNPQETQ